MTISMCMLIIIIRRPSCSKCLSTTTTITEGHFFIQYKWISKFNTNLNEKWHHGWIWCQEKIPRHHYKNKCDNTKKTENKQIKTTRRDTRIFIRTTSFSFTTYESIDNGPIWKSLISLQRLSHGLYTHLPKTKNNW